MPPIRTINVFGDPVEILVDTATSKGLSTTILEIVAPGAGPPPHSHTNEDETFTPLAGPIEMFYERTWHPLAVGETLFCPRNNIHTFRNAGSTPARLLMFITPGGFENFLEQIGPLSPATEMPNIIEIAAKYGITFHL
jgi:quercetin dioxygenase-like cupin family protein